MTLLNSPENNKRYAVIACAVLLRELYACAARSRNIIDIFPLDQGLHDLGEKPMVEQLQKAIDSIDSSKYDALLLGYGLCNNGIRGLHAPIPLVVPRVHDCIAILMGSRAGFQKYFDANPGTFYRSPGWFERASSHLSNPNSTTKMMGMGTYEEYVEKYGAENAQYLIDTLEGGLKHYEKLTYIDSGAGDFPEYVDSSRAEAEQNNWKFEEYHGSTRMLMDMLDGNWDQDDFLVLMPGQTIKATYDDKVIDSSGEAEPGR